MLRQYTSYSLLQHNTFGIDAVASEFVDFSSESELLTFLGNGYDSPCMVIGGGSNLLFVGDYGGTVFHSSIKGIEVVDESDNDVLLRVGSGVNWDELVAYTVEHGWCGMENLSAIPGEAGASAVQNVGAYGVEAGELIEKVEAVSIATGRKRMFTKQQCRFAYRNSIFKAEEKGRNIITYVTYRLVSKALNANSFFAYFATFRVLLIFRVFRVVFAGLSRRKIAPTKPRVRPKSKKE